MQNEPNEQDKKDQNINQNSLNRSNQESSQRSKKIVSNELAQAKIKEVEAGGSSTSLSKAGQNCDNSQSDSTLNHTTNSNPSQEKSAKKAENIQDANDSDKDNDDQPEIEEIDLANRNNLKGKSKRDIPSAYQDAGDYSITEIVGMEIDKDTLADLRKSGLSDSTIAQMDIRTLYSDGDLQEILGFKNFSLNGKSVSLIEAAGGAYAIPYHDGSGFCRVKLIRPVVINGNEAKYLSPKKSESEDQPELCRFYFLKSEAEKLKKRKGAVILTEGEKKAAKGTQDLYEAGDKSTLVLGIPSVNVWRKCFENADMYFAGRAFYIAFDCGDYGSTTAENFDNNQAENHSVEIQAMECYLFLRFTKRVKQVSFLVWDAKLKGIDDYLTANHGKIKDIINEAKSNPFEVLPLFSTELGYKHLAATIATIGSKSWIDKKEISSLWKQFGLETRYHITFAEFYKDVVQQIDYKKKQEAKKQAAANGITAANTTPQKTKPKPTIIEKDGCMFSVTYDKEGNETVEQISNFTITPLRKILEINDDYSYELEISIKGRDDKVEKKTLVILASSMVKPVDFAQVLMVKCGNATYEPDSRKLHNAVLQTCIFSKPIHIAKKSSSIGIIEDDQGKPAGFLTHREFIKPNGEITSLQNCGFIPPKEEDKKPVRIARLSIDDQVCILQTVVNELYATLGFKMIWRFFGWAVATLFAKVIFEKFGQNPLLYFFGKHQSGKTVHANILQGLFGARLIPQSTFLSTQKGNSRILGQYSCIPVVLNEFQSNERNNTFLCSIFDRQGYTIARQTQDMDVKTFPVNAGVVISGTFFPSGTKSEDVLSRMITINFDQSIRSKTFRNIRLPEFMDKLASFIPFCLANIDLSKLMQEINVEENRIVQEVSTINSDMAKYDERTIRNMAILGACYKAFINALASQVQDSAAFKEKFLDAAIDVSIVDTAIDQYQQTGENDIAVNFIQNLMALVTPELNKCDKECNLLPNKFADMVKIERQETTTKISYVFKQIYHHVAIFARQQNREIPDIKTVRAAIERRFNTQNTTARFGKDTHKCDIILVDNDLLE